MDPVKRIGALFVSALAFLLAACGSGDSPEPEKPEVPRGYVRSLEIGHEGRLLKFGPFVGYYFRPLDPKDLTRLHFICFNQKGFYASDMPENARLFEGEAVFQVLDKADFKIPRDRRINPVFFSKAPEVWLENRPRPQDEFLHFHSCYDGAGAVRAGFWLRHQAKARFTYDMGGQVDPKSPLYHKVKPGPDKGFARIVEFDQGPDTKF